VRRLGLIARQRKTKPESSMSVAPASATQFLPPLIGVPSLALRCFSQFTRDGRVPELMLAFVLGTFAVAAAFELLFLAAFVFLFLPESVLSTLSSSSPSSHLVPATAPLAASAKSSSKFNPPSFINSARSSGVSIAKTSASSYSTK